MNGDFENVIPNNGDLLIYQDQFYAKDWLQPTDCTVNIYRDKTICGESNVMDMESKLDFCVNAESGKYCIGLILISYFGYMEHITGQLIEPLVGGLNYEISYYIKFHYENMIKSCNGFGFKFSKTPDIFYAAKIPEEDRHPFYDKIFFQNRIFSDFQINEVILDTNWQKKTFLYTAKGGERHITFGRFSYSDDYSLYKHFERMRHLPIKGSFADKTITQNTSPVIKNYSNKVAAGEGEDNWVSYYMLDNVQIIRLDNDTTDYSICDNCIDTDPKTINIPSYREYKVDIGFVGKMNIEIHPSLKPMEMLVIEYGNKRKIIDSNFGTNILNTVSKLEFPARKLVNKTLRISIEKVKPSQ